LGSTGSGFQSPSEPPVNTVAPALSGTFAEGQTVTCSTGTWTGNPVPTYTYQWYVAGVAESGATSPSLVIPATAKGKSLYCRVTATNTAGSASADSNTVIVVYPYAPAVLALTPLVYYRLNDTAAPFDDASASNSNASLVGTGVAYQQAGLLTNDSDKAIVLSGSTTAISSPALNRMNNNYPFTIVVPLLLTSLTVNKTIWHKGNNNGTDLQGHQLQINSNGSLSFIWNRNITWRSVDSGPGLIVTNVKALWAFVYDGSLNFKIYKNGTLVENMTMFNQPMANTLPLYVGAGRLNAGPTQTFTGTLDDFAYFDKVLTAGEIAGLYSAYSTGTP
jgi:Concanavalin A-like lectin/glucanases superfamily